MRRFFNQLGQRLRARGPVQHVPGPFEYGQVRLPAGVEFLVLKDGAPVERARWLGELTRSKPARQQFDSILREVSLHESALLLEFPVFASLEDRRPARFVLIPSPALSRVEVDRHTFAEHFREGNEASVRAFDNLGRDARLIAPSTRSEFDWPHLAAFERAAPEAVRERLWATAFDEFAAALKAGGPLWFSTSGLGVGWLHVRIDERPKYVTHEPYRDGWRIAEGESATDAAAQ